MPEPLDYQSKRDPDAGRAARREVAFEMCGWIVMGLAAGFTLSVTLWLIFGGTGPPDGFLLVGAGFLVGVLRANAISAR